MKARPTITVIIPTFNYSPYIREAIESVRSCTFPQDEIEIIVVDDGSTDDTQMVVAQYGDVLRCFYQPNAGKAAATRRPSITPAASISLTLMRMTSICRTRSTRLLLCSNTTTTLYTLPIRLSFGMLRLTKRIRKEFRKHLSGIEQQATSCYCTFTGAICSLAAVQPLPVGLKC